MNATANTADSGETHRIIKLFVTEYLVTLGTDGLRKFKCNVDPRAFRSKWLDLDQENTAINRVYLSDQVESVFSEEDIANASEAMQRIGGNFASSIGVALARADAYNRARLIAAFPELIERYKGIQS